MDLSTEYLGMHLKNPLVPSASPLSESIDNIKLMEDSGASAVVLYSLFEEQITHDELALDHHMTEGTESFAEALTYFPEPESFRTGAQDYLELVASAKKSVNIPLIASLNGASPGGWVEYAKEIEQAGADALELNIYNIPTDICLPADRLEASYIEILRSVKSGITIPVAVKLSPFFTNMANTAKKMADSGAKGLVLFNRFYQPDIDPEALEVCPKVLLSTPQDQRLPMRWIAILYGHLGVSLAATSGIHSAQDVVKMVMAGADITMLCSALLKNGIKHLSVIEKDIRDWLETHEYESIKQMKGSLSLKNCPNPSAFERGNYMKTLHSFKSVAYS